MPIIWERRFHGVLDFRYLASLMSERQQSPYDSIARSWLVLVERRQQSFIELCHTGRWRRYYTHAQFLDEMRKVLHLRNQWARLAGLPVSEQIGFRQIDLQQTDLQQPDLQQNIKQSDRPRQGSDAQPLDPLLHSPIAPLAAPHRRSWPPWQGVSDTLDLNTRSPYPRALFKNMTSTGAPSRARMFRR
jgi:hypothetical protein